MPEKSALLRWLIALVLALVAPLFFSSGNAGAAIAGEGLSTQPAPAAEPAKPEEPSFINKDTPEVKKDVDKAHDSIEQGILGQVVRFDNFFGDLKSEDQRNTGYQLQVRNFVRMRKGGDLSFGPSLRANVTLSKISNRLRLYISGDNEPEPIAPRLPEDPGNPGFDRPVLTAKVVNTELRYEFFKTPSTNIFLGAGVRLDIPTETFVRSRIHHTHYINDVTLLRFGETLFANNIVALGETTEISLERILNPKNLLRWASTGTVSLNVRGVEWGTELSLLHEISSRSAITLTGGVYGNTSIDDMITNYRLLARYRRNFLRSWLFYELVPEISWPRKRDEVFPTSYAMTFVLEVVFKGSATGKEIKPLNP
jgi:hypothetical protein